MMMNWLHYLLEANLYLAVAYGCYWLLFRKQTFYTANRVYLLASTVICFVIPLVQFTALQHQTEVAKPVQTTTAISYAVSNAIAPATNNGFITQNKAITALYLIPAAAMLVLFLIKLYSLLKLIFRNKHNKQVGYTLVYVDQSSTPFSFFGYLFVKDSSQLQEIILKHELTHIRQKHSWDIVFTELLKIINWFNPVVYLLQNNLKALHEFEADRCAADNNYQDDYVNMLISQAYQTSGVPFANHFSNQQLLKSRIMKLYQKRSGKLARLNYLVALPLCAGLLCASNMAFSKDYGWIKVGIADYKISNFNRNSSTKQRVNKWAFSVIYKSKMSAYFQFGVKEPNGKITYYKPGTFTDTDKRYLLMNYGMEVTIVNQLNNIGLNDNDTTTVDLPMYGTIDTPKTIKSLLTNDGDLPPPPVISVTKLQSPAKLNPLKKEPLQAPPVLRSGYNKPAYKGAKLPPPPPIEFRSSAKAPLSKSPVKFPAPHQVMEVPLKNTSDSAMKVVFLDMFKHLQHTTRYPKTAADNNVAGAVLASFKVDKDQHVSDVVVKKGAHPALDAETIKNISSYNGTLQAKPGTYTILLDYVLDNGDGSRTTDPQEVIEQEIPTAGKVVVVGYGKKK